MAKSTNRSRNGSVSCAKIERPSPLEKPSCNVRLFAQDRSREYRQKVTVTTPSQTAFHRVFSTSPTNGLRSLSRVKAGTHSAFREGSHTRAHTPKQGCFGRGWYHYPQRTLRAAETPDGRLSKRLICRFLRSGGRSSPHDSYFLANTQNFLLAVPVANAFAL